MNRLDREKAAANRYVQSEGEIMKIGTWKKTFENEIGDYYVFENSRKRVLKIYRTEKTTEKPIWAVEIRDEAKMLYLGRTDTTSKSKAFKLARAYMKKYPGQKEKKERK